MKTSHRQSSCQWQTQDKTSETTARHRTRTQPGNAEEGSGSGDLWRWLWLLIVPAIVLGVLAATVPPGLLWHQEGRGFDVLEYHLGVPKEWLGAGRITYLDHNMYSNFPMNAEMLYMLAMVLYGSPFKAAIAAQMIHLLLGGLAGYAAWLIGRDYSRKAGIVAGIAGVAFPWSIYLGALAYVENGMLFYGLLAAGLCSRAIRDPSQRGWSRALAMGAMVGLACGYKYTAIPMIAVPLLAIWFVEAVSKPRTGRQAASGTHEKKVFKWVPVNIAGRPRRLFIAFAPVLAAGVLFGPWMGKNVWMTGNPVFPLGYGVFGSRVWTPADQARFWRAHSPLPEERPIGARAGLLWQRVIAEPRFGYVPWAAVGIAGLLAAAGLKRRRTSKNSRDGDAADRGSLYRREIVIWLCVLGLEMLVWLFATHLFARFASILWLPMVFLVSIVVAWATERRQARRTVGGTLCVVGLVVYLVVGQGWLRRQYNEVFRLPVMDIVHGNVNLFLSGRIPSMNQLLYINGDGTAEHPGLPGDAKLLMVGDVSVYYVDRSCDYCVTFSHNPFARAVEQAGGSGKRLLGWLRSKGYTHVWVNFADMGPVDPHLKGSFRVTPELIAQLDQAGLKRLYLVRGAGGGFVHGIIYGVPKG